MEWEKWATTSKCPSLGLKFLRDTDWITHFPELNDLIDCPQDPEWHPEGDVFTHTGHCLDAMVELDEYQIADKLGRPCPHVRHPGARFRQTFHHAAQGSKGASEVGQPGA